MIGSKISEPSGAAFDPSMHCVALNGEKVTDKVMIVKDATAIETPNINIVVKTAQGIYTLSGVRVSNDLNKLPKGVYIVMVRKL